MNVRLTSIVAIVALLLVACGDVGAQRKHKNGEVWKENVLLKTGETIVVSREYRWEGSAGDISQSHGQLDYASLDFAYRGANFHWDGEGLFPLTIQVDESGRPMVMAAIAYCNIWRERGQPSSRYVIQRFESNHWVDIDFNEFGTSLASNLASDSKNPEMKGKDDPNVSKIYAFPDPNKTRMNCR